MSLEWDVLTWKQKKAIKLSLKTNDGRISLKFLDNVYGDDKRARKAIETMNNNDIIEKTNLGNKYKIIEQNVPEGEKP